MTMRREYTLLCLLAATVTVTAHGRNQEAEGVRQWRPLPGETFTVAGKAAFLVRPARAAAGKPWVLYAPTFQNSTPNEKDEGWLFQRFLEAGLAVAGVEVGESYGNPAGRAAFTALYEELTRRHGLSKKVCLLARSRGGLMAYNWAAENPDKVACIAGIYPVLDLTTYPGLKVASAAYQLDEAQLRARLKDHNPVERLEPLARAKVPVFHIHGDQDTVVPYPQNAGEPARRYQAFGGTMTVLRAQGQGHSYWPGFFRCQELLDFVVKNAVAKEGRLGR
jgi:dipeptidyl aminopeptidase/acylaminoacyl peptidase